MRNKLALIDLSVASSVRTIGTPDIHQKSSNFFLESKILMHLFSNSMVTGNAQGFFNWPSLSSQVCYGRLGCFSRRSYCDETLFSLLPESPGKIGTKFFLYTNPQVLRQEIDYDMTHDDFVNAGFNSSKETKVCF